MRRKKDRSNGITALYERLSRDDDNAGESNSIVHQKQMLEDYAIKHGFTNLVHFTDDGWSGATFDRPSWNRLVEGVKNGEITACICKDMSRIGRDHLQVGFFTDILFREKEVRFIAINNGIDSDRQETSEFAPFLNIMNEWFVRDTSKKIKAVLKSRGSSGNAHTSNIPPYGYLKDPENPDHWIIDEEAAEVVRRIYRMTIEGKGPYQIARELSEEKIERPSYYLGKKGLGNHASNYDKENPYMWRGNQVTTLIARPVHFAYRARQEKKEIILSGSDHLSLFCDRDWLNEAIDNIVKNAFDHTESGATIRVAWKELPSGVQIVITDNGCGIHPEDIHHIFKRFYRSRFSKDKQGIGLGLPLAKAIVEAHNGTIEVDSELGIGTTFTMNFLIPTKL